MKTNNQTKEMTKEQKITKWAKRVVYPCAALLAFYLAPGFSESINSLFNINMPLVFSTIGLTWLGWYSIATAK